MIEVPCRQCGAPVRRKPAELRRRPRVFCSQGCYQQSTRVDLSCSWCGARIARRRCDVVTTTDLAFCDVACLGRYRSAFWVGPAHAGFKGIKVERRRVLLFQPDHPRADHKGYVRRALLVAEAWRRRPIPPSQVVHHVDDDSLNDSPLNLETLTRSSHSRLHALRRAARGGQA